MIAKPQRAALLAWLVVMLVPAIAFAAGDGSFAEYEKRGLVWMHLAAFGFGFLTSLTPCVYPMIPIVLGVFGARDENVSRRKAFVLATMYVLGMGLLFATLGTVFALIGKGSGFGELLANPWVVIPLVAIYVALALSMFGAFEMNLPSGLQNKLNQVGGRGYGGAFLLGTVGGFTAAPCTGPVLVGIIGVVAAKGDPVLGFSLMFTYAVGIGTLFFALALFALSLPKSGRWMEWVKSVGGVALLAAAFYFLQPLLPMKTITGALSASSNLFLVGSIAFVVLGLIIGAIHLSFHDRTTLKLRKLAGVTLMVAGLSGMVVNLLTPDRYLPWVYDEQTAFAQAKAENKGVMIDFAADWCTPCKALEVTFSEQGVYENIIGNYVPLKFDVTDATDEDEEKQEKYNAENLPAVIFLDAEGNEYARINKEVSAEEFRAIMEPAIKKMRAGTKLTSSQ